jgi:hypothetical protein
MVGIGERAAHRPHHLNLATPDPSGRRSVRCLRRRRRGASAGPDPPARPRSRRRPRPPRAAADPLSTTRPRFPPWARSLGSTQSPRPASTRPAAGADRAAAPAALSRSIRRQIRCSAPAVLRASSRRCARSDDGRRSAFSTFAISSALLSGAALDGRSGSPLDARRAGAVAPRWWAQRSRQAGACSQCLRRSQTTDHGIDCRPTG